MNLLDKYLGEGDPKSWGGALARTHKHKRSIPPMEQQKAVDDLRKKGFKIVIWEVEYVAMMDKKGNPAEVYPDGKVKYPKKRK